MLQRRPRWSRHLGRPPVIDGLRSRSVGSHEDLAFLRPLDLPDRAVVDSVSLAGDLAGPVEGFVGALRGFEGASPRRAH